MIAEIVEKSHITDFYIIFDKQLNSANKSVRYFQEQYELEGGQFSQEDYQSANKFKIYMNETINKGRSKQNISSLIAKYSKPKQLESSNVFMQNCQREPFLIIIVLCKEEFIDFLNIQQIVEKEKDEDCKIILILEEVKELIFAQNNYYQYQKEYENFILDLQLTYKVDALITNSKKQTFDEILQCMLCGIQFKKKKNKVPCLFRDRQLQISDPLMNQYELMWLSMLVQIPGISEAKAKAIVQEYPTVKSLILAYEKTPLDQKPYMLSQIDVHNGIVQQTSKKLGNKLSEMLYTLFSMRDSEYKLLD